ncbi:MAG: hypothetical protein JWP97_6520 [Labilithrix sp.]|nr:hypothetical protein [Labilithrix sp.]
MFLVRGSFQAAGASIRSHSVLSPRVYIGATQHCGTIFDSRFVPAPRRAANQAMIFLVVEGTTEWSGPLSGTFQGPVAFRMGSADYDGAGQRKRQTFRNHGARFRGIDIRFVTPAVTRNAELWVCSEAVWDAARRYVAELWDGEREGASAAYAIALVRALEEDGVVAEEVASSMDARVEEPLGDLLQAMGRHYESFDFLPTLQSIASALDVSLRSLSRLMTSLWRTFPALPWNFRELMLGVRIRFAIHLLSVEQLPVHDIARAAGYRHPETMANAFKNAGLPSPREVRALLLGSFDTQAGP